MATAVVLSGVARRQDVEAMAHPPDLVLNTIGELPAKLGLRHLFAD
jgi:ribonucleotide monophosphatase NagD (HAD superfamily)